MPTFAFTYFAPANRQSACAPDSASRVVIEDERVVQALRLTELYDLIDKVDDVDKLLELSTDEIDRIFNKLPKEYKDNFKDEIYVKVKTRELKDLEIIDALSKILDIDLRNI